MTQEELLEARLEAIEAIVAPAVEAVDIRVTDLEARYTSHEETLSRLAIRVGNLESQMKDLENRLDGLFDDVHHGGDD